METKQTVESEQATESVIDEKKNTTDVDEEADASDEVPRVDEATESAIQHQFNELRREYLDHRANSINWWLRVVGIVLTVFGLIIPFVGYFAYQKFEKLESQAENHVIEAQKYSNEAEKHLEKMREYEEEAGEILSKWRSEDAVKSFPPGEREVSSQIVKFVQEVERDPNASFMDKAVVEAYKLKQIGRIDESIEKWRSIANIAEGTDNDLAAGAWFAVGSLYTPEDEKDEDISVHTFDKSIFLPGYLDKPFRPTMSYVGQNVNRDVIEKAISSYDQAIRLKSDFLEAYLNRGLAKYALDKYDEAITDYNKVIQLEPDFAGVYSNRGIAKSALGKHKEAIADHDKAIHLKPDLVIAYNNRGVAKSALGQRESAIIDYNETIRLKPDFAGVYSNRGTASADSY